MNLPQKLRDFEKRLEAQEQILSQTVVSIAEMTAALEMVMATFLEDLDEDGQRKFIERFDEGRRQMFDYMGQLINDKPGTDEDTVAAATLAEMDRRVSDPPTGD